MMGRICIGRPSQERRVVLFTASRGDNFVGGTCAPPSALLVVIFFKKFALAELK